jgi:phage terminase large subunit
VYPDLESCKVDKQPCSDECLQAGRRIGAIDFGFSSPFGCLAANEYIDEETKEGIIYIFYERYKSGKMLQEHATAIPKGYLYYCDSARPDSIAELRAAGHSAIPAIKDIQIGVSAVTRRIMTRTLKIHSSCKALFAEGNEYRYPDPLEEKASETPIDEFNHLMDCLRYLIMGVDKRRVASG